MSQNSSEKPRLYLAEIYYGDFSSRLQTTMTEELDLITFDAGGTLFDMNPTRDDVFVSTLDEHFAGMDKKRIVSALRSADKAFDEEFATQDGENEDPFWKRYDDYVFGLLGLRTDTSALHRTLSSRFGGLIPRVDSWVVYPETRSILEGLRHRDFKLGVISNATDLVKKVLDNLGLTKYFDFVIVSADVGYRKPTAEIFRIACKRAGAPTNRALHVGDKYTVDIVGARRAGLNAILVDRSGTYEGLDCIRAKDLSYFSSFVGF